MHDVDVVCLIHFLQVGNEFGAVEALWSQFEGVMATKDDSNHEGSEGRREDDEGEGEGDTVAQGGGEGS